MNQAMKGDAKKMFDNDKAGIIAKRTRSGPR
jgi:hypothetical protein